MQLLERKSVFDDNNKPSIIPLALDPNVVAEDDLDHLSDQWREITSYKADLEHLSNMDLPAFWMVIQKLTNLNNQPKFKVLSDFMCTLVALPHLSTE